MTLGQRIQELRKQRGLSQESLGEALGVSRQAVSKWEGDNGIPELDTLIAMSKLFGVTLGQLLGLEENAPQGEEPSSDADRMEELLRRYTEAARREPPQRSKPLWIAAGAAVGIILLLLFQVGSLRRTVDSLRANLSSLESQVFLTQSNLSSQIRSTIYDVLAEEAQLLSTFQWKLVGLDLENQTATVRLSATMKEYSAGSRLRFHADWKAADQTAGQTAGDWAEGPDFTSELTLPLSYSVKVGIRVEDKDGNIREQQVEEIYGLHPDDFKLRADNLTVPFAITTKAFGLTSVTTKGEQAWVSIWSTYPEFIRPEKAVLTAELNGQQIFREEMTITEAGEGKANGDFRASIRDDYVDLTMKNGDRLEVQLLVTDNLGRTEQFRDAVAVSDGYVERGPLTSASIAMD